MATGDMSRTSRPSSLSSCIRLVYLHVVLLLTLFGASEATTVTSTSTGRGGCPLSRLHAAFQAPFNCLSSALHGPTEANPVRHKASGTITSREGTAAPRWVTEGASTVSGRARMLRARAVNVAPLAMSAVETKQGTKRAAVDEPEAKEDKAEKKARRMMASSKPLGVHVIGLSHHNAGVETREKLAVPEAEWNLASAKVSRPS